MEIAKPFIQLPYSFDASRLADEVNALDNDAWMEHPSRMSGNSAVALLSCEGGDNDDFDGRMTETPHLKRCPYIRQVMASFDEVLGRSRLMKLSADSEVSLHVDFNYHWYTRVRIHIPVITNPDVTFYCADESIHMQAGESWIFNSWRRHRVVNGGRDDRIHLVIDTAGSSRFWRTVREMELLDPHMDKDVLDEQVRTIPFDPGKQVAIETERYNTAPIMSPGELDALVTELLRDIENHPGNDLGLVARYAEILTDFRKDWRETWHRYGYERSGWPHYQKVIETLQQQLDPNPRALVTHSNELGVNPIIVQRILRSAIATERYDQFVGAAESN